jgi:hypothetical protein
MPYALDAEGRPLLLISTLAVHTRNLQADPRTSLLITQPDISGEPLAGGRVTLMGRAGRVGEGEAAAREAYLTRQPTARYWADYQDFALWRLEVSDIYFVAGFGAMGWVDPGEYRQARPTPLERAHRRLP